MNSSTGDPIVEGGGGGSDLSGGGDVSVGGPGNTGNATFVHQTGTDIWSVGIDAADTANTRPYKIARGNDISANERLEVTDTGQLRASFYTTTGQFLSVADASGLLVGATPAGGGNVSYAGADAASATAIPRLANVNGQTIQTAYTTDREPEIATDGSVTFRNTVCVEEGDGGADIHMCAKKFSNTSGQTGEFIFQRARTAGEVVSDPVVNNNQLGNLRFEGWDGDGVAPDYGTGALIRCRAKGTWTAASHPTEIDLRTNIATENGATGSSRLLIDENGNIDISGNTTTNGDFTSTTGNILAAVGNVTANGAVTGNNGLTAVTGGLDVQAGGGSITGGLTLTDIVGTVDVDYLTVNGTGVVSASAPPGGTANAAIVPVANTINNAICRFTNTVSNDRDIESAYVVTKAPTIDDNGALGIPASIQMVGTANDAFVRFPNLTQAVRDTIPTPGAGTSVYNTNTNTLEFYNGATWIDTGGAGGANAVTATAAFGTDNILIRSDGNDRLAQGYTSNAPTCSDNGEFTIPAGMTFSGTGTTAFVRFPNLTTTQRNALTGAPGMQIFNTTNSTMEFWDGAVWVNMGVTAGSVVPVQTDNCTASPDLDWAGSPSGEPATLAFITDGTLLYVPPTGGMESESNPTSVFTNGSLYSGATADTNGVSGSWLTIEINNAVPIAGITNLRLYTRSDDIGGIRGPAQYSWFGGTTATGPWTLLGAEVAQTWPNTGAGVPVFNQTAIAPTVAAYSYIRCVFEAAPQANGFIGIGEIEVDRTT